MAGSSDEHAYIAPDLFTVVFASNEWAKILFSPVVWVRVPHMCVRRRRNNRARGVAIQPARPHSLLFDPSVMENLPGFAGIYSCFCAPSCSSQEVARLVAHARS